MQTYTADFKLSYCPLWEHRFRQHLNNQVSIVQGILVMGPVLITLYLQGHKERDSVFTTAINNASIQHWQKQKWQKQTSDLLCLMMKEERQQLNSERDATLCHVNKQDLAWEQVSMAVESGSSDHSFVMGGMGSTSLLPSLGHIFYANSSQISAWMRAMPPVPLPHLLLRHGSRVPLGTSEVQKDTDPILYQLSSSP